jgi:hypothetical protein
MQLINGNYHMTKADIRSEDVVSMVELPLNKKIIGYLVFSEIQN